MKNKLLKFLTNYLFKSVNKLFYIDVIYRSNGISSYITYAVIAPTVEDALKMNLRDCMRSTNYGEELRRSVQNPDGYSSLCCIVSINRVT